MKYANPTTPNKDEAFFS